MSKIEKILTDFGSDLVLDLERSLDPKKDATGELRNSIRFQIQNYGDVRYSFKLYLADYYKYVDKGRKPGKFPPPQAIQKWIIDKRLKFESGRGPRGGKRFKQFSDDQKKLKQLTFLIGRKIKQHGIPPTHFYSKVVTKNRIDKLKRDLTSAIREQIIIDIL